MKRKVKVSREEVAHLLNRLNIYWPDYRLNELPDFIILEAEIEEEKEKHSAFCTYYNYLSGCKGECLKTATPTKYHHWSWEDGKAVCTRCCEVAVPKQDEKCSVTDANVMVAPTKQEGERKVSEASRQYLDREDGKRCLRCGAKSLNGLCVCRAFFPSNPRLP